jgi:hypothetical protein
MRVHEAREHRHLPPRAAVGVALGRALVEHLEGVARRQVGRGRVVGDEEHGAHGTAAEDAQRSRPVQVDVHGRRHGREGGRGFVRCGRVGAVTGLRIAQGMH